jgi:hypothetical protein
LLIFSSLYKFTLKLAGYLAADLALSRRVVNALTGDLPLTLRANFKTKWLRRVPVRRGLVRFLGLPMVLKILLTMPFGQSMLGQGF